MTDPLTSAELEAIRARAEKATTGPWHWSIEDHSMACLEGPGDEEDFVLTVSPCRHCYEGKTEWKWGRCHTPSEEDARFVSHARTDIPKLLAEVDRLRGALERAAAALPPEPEHA